MTASTQKFEGSRNQWQLEHVRISTPEFRVSINVCMIPFYQSCVVQVWELVESSEIWGHKSCLLRHKTGDSSLVLHCLVLFKGKERSFNYWAKAKSHKICSAVRTQLPLVPTILLTFKLLPSTIWRPKPISNKSGFKITVTTWRGGQNQAQGQGKVLVAWWGTQTGSK